MIIIIIINIGSVISFIFILIYFSTTSFSDINKPMKLVIILDIGMILILLAKHNMSFHIIFTIYVCDSIMIIITNIIS